MDVRPSRFENGGNGFAGWRARVGPGRGIPTPAVARNSVIVGGGFGSHEVYALDAATGAPKWQVHTRDDGPTAAVVLDGTALFNTESCTLMAVDVETGTVRWEKWLGDPLLAQPAAADGRVLMVFPRDGAHWLGAFELRTGNPQWEARLAHDVITAPVVATGHVYAATYDGSVTCLDLTSGHVRWTEMMHATSAPWVSGDTVHVAQRSAPSAQHTSQRRPAHEAAAAPSNPMPRERTVTLTARDGTVKGAFDWKSAAYLRADWGSQRKGEFHAQDASVGFAQPPASAKMHAVHHLVGEGHVSRAWRFQGSRPVVIDGVVYEPTGGGLEARAVDTGQRIWAWTGVQGVEGERCLTPPVVANGRVLVGTWDGRLVSLDAADGRVRWEVRVGAPIHWQPVMVNGRVFAGLEDGSLVSFETGDPRDDGWPMWGGGHGHNGPEQQTGHVDGRASNEAA